MRVFLCCDCRKTSEGTDEGVVECCSALASQRCGPFAVCELALVKGGQGLSCMYTPPLINVLA